MRCLIGPNGAGKSSFFKCLIGRHEPGRASGRVLIGGHDITGWRTHRIVRLGVGIKTQVPSLMNGLTVEENLWLAARRVHRARHDPGAAVADVLAQLELAASRAAIAGELSHGQRQLVEIGIVLAGRPVARAARRAGRRHDRRRDRAARRR